METAGLVRQLDADRCQSPDSSFNISLTDITGGGAAQAEEDLLSPTGAQTPDVANVDAQNFDPKLPLTVAVRSPTASAGGKTTTAAAGTTPSSRLDARKVAKGSRNSSPAAETLGKKRTARSKDGMNVIVEKPVGVLSSSAGRGGIFSSGRGSDGMGLEENKAPSPSRSKHPIGLPPLSRARTSSAQPASCGKQAAAPAAPAMPAAPASGLKRSKSSQSPIGLGGAALPVPPGKRARTASTSLGTGVVGPLIDHQEIQRLRHEEYQGQRDKKNTRSLRTSLRVANKTEQQQQQQRVTRHQRAAATKRSNTIAVPEWVQRASAAPQMNQVLLSAAEKIKPLEGKFPVWKIDASGKEVAAGTVDEEEEGAGKRLNRQQQQQQQQQQQLPPPSNATDTKVSPSKNSVLLLPGWEAIHQTADVAPREYEECETVAEMLTRGAQKRAKYQAQREYTTVSNNNNNLQRNGNSPVGNSLTIQGQKLNLADRSLYRQGFGISEFAARMSLVASGLPMDVVEKESLVQRTKRIMNASGAAATGGAAADALEQGGKGVNKNRCEKYLTEKEKKVEKQQQQRGSFAIGHAISNKIAPLLYRQPSRAAGRAQGARPGAARGVGRPAGKKSQLASLAADPNPRSTATAAAGRVKNVVGTGKKKPGPKPKSGNATATAVTAKNVSCGGGGNASRQQKSNTAPASVPAPENVQKSERITPPPKVWPPTELLFVHKGDARPGINVNYLARGKRLSGSGLDKQLWIKLWKEQKAAANANGNTSAAEANKK